MPRTIGTPRHEALRAYLVRAREKAGLRQVDVAQRLGRHQPFLTFIENGQRRIDVVEFLELADAIGFDPHAALRIIRRAPKQ